MVNMDGAGCSISEPVNTAGGDNFGLVTEISETAAFRQHDPSRAWRGFNRILEQNLDEAEHFDTSRNLNSVKALGTPEDARRPSVRTRFVQRLGQMNVDCAKVPALNYLRDMLRKQRH